MTDQLLKTPENVFDKLPAHPTLPPTLDELVDTDFADLLEKFKFLQTAMYDTFAEKNAPEHYNSAFRSLGLLGVGVEVFSIASRLLRIIVRSGDGGEKFPTAKLEDIFVDLGVYAVIAIICIREQNWTGK